MNEDDATPRRTGKPAPPPPPNGAKPRDKARDRAAAAPSTAPPRAQGSGVDVVVSVAAYLVLALLGFAYGLFGAFHQDWTVGTWPLPAIGLCVVLFGLVYGAGFGMGSKLGAVVPAAVWMVVTFVMSSKQSEGDLVVPGTTAGYVYIIGGMVAALLAIALAPSRGGPGEWLTGQWSAGGRGDTRG